MIRYQINQSLKFNPASFVFIISYQDEALYQHILEQITHTFQLQTKRHLDIAQTSDWVKITEATQHYELFNEPKCYECQLGKSALNTKIIPKLNPVSGDIIILKTTVFKHKLLEQLSADPNASWIQSYSPSVNDLWLWISGKLRNYNLDPAIKPWYLQQTNLNLSQCKDALEKINLSQLDQNLSLEAFQNHLGVSSAEENWTPLIEAWMQGLRPRAIALLRQAASEQHELTLLVWLLARNLQVFYALQQKCRTPQDIFSAFKIWPQQTALFNKNQAQFTATHLKNLINLIQETDAAIKSGKTAQAWLKLELFLMTSPHA